jgi:hypothetical protein
MGGRKRSPDAESGSRAECEISEVDCDARAFHPDVEPGVAVRRKKINAVPASFLHRAVWTLTQGIRDASHERPSSNVATVDGQSAAMDPTSQPSGRVHRRAHLRLRGSRGPTEQSYPT